MSSAVLLPHRSVLGVHGPDARVFLQNILTLDTVSGPADAHGYGALLTPQGKILSDMILVPDGDGFLLDVDTSAAADLSRRLSMFRLRSNVVIAARDDLAVAAFAGAPDPRSPLTPHRNIVTRADLEEPSGADLARYHAARIAAGLAEQGSDFGPAEVFPADINMDLLGGVDFRKGCYVGQEVVSRMKRRSTARRRTLTLTVPDDVAAPAPVLAGDTEIGVVTSTAGGRALARLRIDRLAEADAAGHSVTVGGHPVAVIRPDWLEGELRQLAAARQT